MGRVSRSRCTQIRDPFKLGRLPPYAHGRHPLDEPTAGRELVRRPARARRRRSLASRRYAIAPTHPTRESRYERHSQLMWTAHGRYLVALSGGLCDPLIRGCSTPRIRQRVRVVGVGSAGCPCAASTLSTRRQRVASIPATGAGTSSNRRAASLLPAAGHRLARPLARVAPSVAPKPVRDCSTGR